MYIFLPFLVSLPVSMLSFCRTPDSPVNLSSVHQTKLEYPRGSLCARCAVLGGGGFFSFKEGTFADEGLTALHVNAGVDLLVCVGAAQRLSLLCASVSASHSVFVAASKLSPK